MEQFISSNVELPLLTQTLLAFSEIFPVIIAVVLIILTVVYVVQVTKITPNKYQLLISKYFLFIPLIGHIILYDQTARFCSSMRLMTKAG